MNEKEFQPVELEEILKEFGQPEEVPEENPQQEDVTGDTIRLDKIQKAVKAATADQETTAFHPVGQETAVFQPVDQEEELDLESVIQEVAAEAAAEPFSEEWEPEYDEPMGQYSQEPIAFKPKTRLQQLRAKLVAGPEKRYYELSELGFGKLQVGIFLNLLIFALAAGSTVLYALDMVSPERLRLVVFIQLFCMLASALVGCYRLIDGVGDLVHLRFSLHSLLLITCMVCFLDAFFCLESQRISCSAIFCLQMLMAQIAAYQRRHTEIGQMDTLRKAPDLEAVVLRPDYWEGRPGLLTAQGEPEAFMDHYDRPSAPARALQIYGLVSLAISIGLGVWGGSQEGFAAGVQVTAGALLLSMPATAFISMTRPENLLEKRLHKLGAVVCGWQGVKAMPKKAAYPISHEDLFTKGSTKLNGMKILDPVHPDLVVIYAASVVSADGGTLEPVFTPLREARNGSLLPVEDMHSYPGGVTGVVDGHQVAMGTMDFMGHMQIPMPENIKVKQAVCIAVDGKLAGMFAVNYTRSKLSGMGLRTLCSFGSIQPVLTSCDFMLTPEFLQKKYHFNGRRLRMPERQVRKELQAVQPQEDAPVVALTTREGLAPKAFAVTGAKVLKTSWMLGAIIHILGGSLGLIAAGLLTWAGAMSVLTPVNLLLYGLIWMVPGFLVTQWTRVL